MHNISEPPKTRHGAAQSRDSLDLAPENILVMGIGAQAYGMEKRAANMLSRTRRLNPYFLLSKYSDDTVSKLLQKYDFGYEYAPFGYLGRARLDWTTITLLQLPRLLQKVIWTSIRQRCKHLVLFSFHPLYNALPALIVLQRLMHCRISFYLGDIPPFNAAYRMIAGIANRLSNTFVVNSVALKSRLVELGIQENKIHVIYNGVDIQSFVDVKPYGLRKRFGWGQQTRLIGYVGQFIARKGVDDFIQAMRIVNRQQPDCRFPMICPLYDNDPYQQQVIAYMRSEGLDSVLAITGRIEPDQMPAVYADLDVLVVPSRHEDSAPNVNIEAMAAGVPVIASRAGGNPELIAEGECGMLVDRGKPEQIAHQVFDLVLNRQKRDMFGAAGRERARQYFDVESNAKRLEHILLTK